MSVLRNGLSECSGILLGIAFDCALMSPKLSALHFTVFPFWVTKHICKNKRIGENENMQHSNSTGYLNTFNNVNLIINRLGYCGFLNSLD